MKEKHTSKALKGHFDKAGTTPKRKLVEFKADFPKELKLGDTVTVSDLSEGVEWVDVTGISKGKGFQGVVDRLRHPGSMGASSWPSRVFKGMRMAGRMGGDRVKVLNLKVIKVIPENNLVLVKGSIPGAKGSYVIVED